MSNNVIRPRKTEVFPTAYNTANLSTVQTHHFISDLLHFVRVGLSPLLDEVCVNITGSTHEFSE